MRPPSANARASGRRPDARTSGSDHAFDRRGPDRRAASVWITPRASPCLDRLTLGIKPKRLGRSSGKSANMRTTPSGLSRVGGGSYHHVRPMDDGLRDRMLAYYNERASEYEEAYTRGTGTASITDPAVFTTEIAVLEDIVRGFGRGHLLDVACGTGYWLPHYIANCSRITLFDQSEQMLAECESKVAGASLYTDPATNAPPRFPCAHSGIGMD